MKSAVAASGRATAAMVGPPTTCMPIPSLRATAPPALPPSVPFTIRASLNSSCPMSAVRQAPDPDALLLGFLQETYVAAADAAGWDRTALERSAP